MSEISPGQHVGNYEIVRKLGEGGMGAVYEARHVQIGRRAAIKVLHAHIARRPQFAQRFFNEARSVNVIEHPGLVEVYEYGQLPDGAAFIVMEFLRGETLRDRLQGRGPMTPRDAIHVGRQMALALAAAHDKRIVHRDLKPENVMIIPDAAMPSGERVKILDFGIAKVAASPGDSGLATEADALMGTPAYMSPEQCRGAGGVTDRSDVYALGVMLYELLTGQPPFNSKGSGAIIAMHMMVEPPPLSSFAPTTPQILVDLVHNMMIKDPDPRPRMAEVAEALSALEFGRPEIGPAVIRRPATTGALPAPAYTTTLGDAAGQHGGAGRGASGLIALGLAVLVVGGIGASRLLRGKGDAARVQVPAAAPPATPEPAPPREAPPPRTAAPRTVRWAISSTPPGARVVRVSDGELLGTTPLDHEEPAGTGVERLRLERAGSRPADLVLPRGGDSRRALTLLPATQPHPQRPPVRPPAPSSGVKNKEKKPHAFVPVE